MAKAFQTKAWTSLVNPDRSTLRYDKDHIARCLQEIETQRRDWQRWFEANNVTPYVVNYEDLIEDSADVVRVIVELLGVAAHPADEVRLPKIEKQGDTINEEWAAQFRDRQ
jgi:LPS sulfotransferase NodH